MGVTAAISVGVIAAGTAAYSIDQQQKQTKAASDLADQQKKDTSNQLAQAAQQKTDAQNQSANATAAAQARVRGIANASPDGGTLMTPPSTGPTTGKTLLGT